MLPAAVWQPIRLWFKLLLIVICWMLLPLSCHVSWLHLLCNMWLQINDWLADTLPEGSRVGFDPFCHTVEAVNKLRAKLQVGVLCAVACICVPF
jgi:hypothetical protein